jgi:hypothetical protein
MSRMIRKAELPSKDCAACGRPFAWRKKWAKVWDEVRFCSDRCRAERRPAPAVPEADRTPRPRTGATRP